MSLHFHVDIYSFILHEFNYCKCCDVVAQHVERANPCLVHLKGTLINDCLLCPSAVSKVTAKSPAAPAARTIGGGGAGARHTAASHGNHNNNNNSNNNHVSNQQIEELSTQVMDMRINLEGLEKERDFYYSKLRDIEIL